jgi:hypothetical protein
VTRATLLVNDFAWTGAMNILLIIGYGYLDRSIQNKIQKVFS